MADFRFVGHRPSNLLRQVPSFPFLHPSSSFFSISYPVCLFLHCNSPAFFIPAKNDGEGKLAGRAGKPPMKCRYCPNCGTFPGQRRAGRKGVTCLSLPIRKSPLNRDTALFTFIKFGPNLPILIIWLMIPFFLLERIKGLSKKKRKPERKEKGRIFRPANGFLQFVLRGPVRPHFLSIFPDPSEWDLGPTYNALFHPVPAFL